MKNYKSIFLFLLYIIFIGCKNRDNNNIEYKIFIYDLKNKKQFSIDHDYNVIPNFKTKSKLKFDQNILKKLDILIQENKNKTINCNNDTGIFFTIVRDSMNVKDSLSVYQFYYGEGYDNDLKTISPYLYKLFISLDTISH